MSLIGIWVCEVYDCRWLLKTFISNIFGFAVLKSLYCIILCQCHHLPLHILSFMYITFSACQFKQVWCWGVDQMLILPSRNIKGAKAFGLGSIRTAFVYSFFSEPCSRVRVRAVMPAREIANQSSKNRVHFVIMRPGRKPLWPFSSFDSTISRHFLSRHLTLTFPGKLRSDIPQQFVHSCDLLCFFEYRNNHTCLPISGSFAKLLCNWYTCVNQSIPSPVSAFNISGLISSSPAAAFPDIIPLIAVATLAAVKTSSFPKCVTSYVSLVDALTGFKISLKYSIYCERISFSFMRMLPGES